MTEREIIFECVIGSRLYGTSFSTSDDDFLGVFIPTEDDLYGLQNCPPEMSKSVKVSDGERNTKGDVDRKFYSIKRYIDLILSGQQSTAVEMLFAPPEMIVTSTNWWYLLLTNRSKFLSKKSVVGTLGFAKAQAYKAYLKGGNLNLIRSLIESFKEHQSSIYDKTVGDLCGVTWESPRPAKCILFGQEIDFVDSDNKAPVIEIAGRKYDINGRAKFLADSLKELESRYGTRSNAAANNGYDYKSLYHCYRLLGEARELLTTGVITLPRPKKEREFLMSLRSNEPNRENTIPMDLDFFADITQQIAEIESLVPDSVLPNEPDRSFANNFCIALIKQSLERR